MNRIFLNLKCSGRFALLMFVFALATAEVSAQQEPHNNAATRKPSVSADAAIERFVAECVSIKPGEAQFPKRFRLGTDAPNKDEIAAHEVTLDHSFRISKYEVTQELYAAVMGANPSRWKGLRNSVEQVSFLDAKQFCVKLSELLTSRKMIAEGWEVRLPTSVEWEYCCRSGAKTRFSFGNSAGPDGTTTELDKHAWHTGNAAGNDPAVGVLEPNGWGLFDVHGYLWEYVSDENAGDSQQIPLLAGECLIRGGSWRAAHMRLSCSTYLKISETQVSDAVGFRCVIAEKPEVKLPPRR